MQKNNGENSCWSVIGGNLLQREAKMQKLTSLERIFRTLALQEPDYVPTLELIIDQKVRDAILPGASYEDFVEFMDLDAAVYYDWAYDRYEILDEAKGIIRDKFGVIKRWTSEVDPMPVEAVIKREYGKYPLSL
jgi:hypothetical protein